MCISRETVYCSVFFRKASLLSMPFCLKRRPSLGPWTLARFPQQRTRIAIVGCIITVRKTCTVVNTRTWGVGRVNVSKPMHAWKVVFHFCFMCYCCVRVVNVCRNWIHLILFFLFACPVCVTVAALVFQWNLILFPRERSKERIAFKCRSRCLL